MQRDTKDVPGASGSGQKLPQNLPQYCTNLAPKLHQKDRFFVGVNAVRISDTLLNDHA